VAGGLGRGGLLGEQVLVDVGHDAAARDGGAAEQLRQLLVVADSQLDVARHDAGLLVVPRSVPGQLQNLVDLGKTNHEVGRAHSDGWGIFATGQTECFRTSINHNCMPQISTCLRNLHDYWVNFKMPMVFAKKQINREKNYTSIVKF